jgi:hypothetical protein
MGNGRNQDSTCMVLVYIWLHLISEVMDLGKNKKEAGMNFMLVHERMVICSKAEIFKVPESCYSYWHSCLSEDEKMTPSFAYFYGQGNVLFSRLERKFRWIQMMQMKQTRMTMADPCFLSSSAVDFFPEIIHYHYIK